MNDRRYDEREWSERLTDGGDAERVDALVRAAAERTDARGTSDDRLRAERDRRAVLDRIASHPSRTTGPRRSAPRREPRLPWWRVAAPIAVAAGLAGLFFLREIEPPSLDEAISPTAPVPSASPEAAAPADDADAPSALMVAEPKSVAAGEAETLARRLDERPPAARVTLVDPVVFRSEEALRRLGPADEPHDLATATRDSLIEVLRELRPRIEDPELARRVDAWVAPTH